MRGNTKWQVNEILGELDSFGVSKHDTKEVLRADGTKDWHNMGQRMGIHHDATKDNYRTTLIQFCNYCKTEFGIKDVTKIDGNHASAWLEKKGFEDGIMPKTFDNYASALQKFSLGLEVYTGKEYEWNPQIQEIQGAYKEVVGCFVSVSRSFENPTAVWGSMDNRLIGEVMHSCGLRINEIHTVQLKEDGTVWVTGKGNYTREIFPSDNLKSRIEDYMERNGGTLGFKSRAEQNALRDDIKQSCLAVGENYSGSHSFRHNFAQETYAACRTEGKGYHQSCAETSERLGHHREDVVGKFYLK